MIADVTGIGSAIALAGTVAAGLLWWIQRRAAKNDDPGNQDQKRYEQIDQDIANRDSTAATSHATDDLDDLDRLQNRPGSGH